MFQKTLQFLVVVSVLTTAGLGLNQAASAATPAYQAEIVEQSNYIINLLPDKGFTFSVKFRNTGTQAWSVNDRDFLSIKTANQPSPVAHEFWVDKQTPVATQKKVNPGETIALSFAIQAPASKGLYIEYFGLTYGGGSMIPGSFFELPVNITDYPRGQAPRPAQKAMVQTTADENPPKNEKIAMVPTKQQTTAATSQPATTETKQTGETSEVRGVQTASVQDLPLLDRQPIIDVGLYFAENKKITVTADGEFGVYENGTKQASFGAGTMAKVEYIGGVYNLILPSGTASFSQPLTFKPLSTNTVLELPDYSRPVAWNSSINDNRYLGEIQVKYNPRTDRLWAVNSLWLEDYVAGLDETSNIDVPEFHKALSIAARTYALFHLLDNQRYNGFFHIDDHNDQVYRGYNAMRRLSHWVAAVKETRGQAATKSGQIVVTPYFTQSDGQTKSYTQVWGTPSSISSLDVSHLLSVSVPQDVGRQLLGHGVGMSAQGAQRMAYLDGLDYLSILQHFYTNVQISKIYP